MNNSGTSLSKILNGINSTLNIANKAIPLFKETKPIINSAKQTYNTLKNNKNDLTNMFKLMKVKNAIKKDMKEPLKNIDNIAIDNNKKTITNTTYKNINNPKFFI